MRKEKRTSKASTMPTAVIDSYHCSGGQFSKTLYFGSDRAWELRDVEVPKAYGLEVETECATINAKSAYATVLKNYVFAGFPQNMWRFETDGSLGHGEFPAGSRYERALTVTTSAECVSACMTKERMRNLYSAFEVMYKKFAELEIRTGASRRPQGDSTTPLGTGNCGMHVNISNACFGTDIEKQREAIRKFAYVVNNHKAFMCALLRRDINRTGYCEPTQKPMAHFMGLDITSPMACRDMFDHYTAFNLAHYMQGRVELRLVGGQPTFTAFRCTMETIFALVEACKRLPWNALDNWTRVFDKANKHVVSRLKLCVDEGVLDRATYETIRANGSGKSYALN